MGRRQAQVTNVSGGVKTSPKRLLPPALKRPVAPILPSLAGNQATNTALSSGSANRTEGRGAVAATGASPTGTWTPLQPLLYRDQQSATGPGLAVRGRPSLARRGPGLPICQD